VVHARTIECIDQGRAVLWQAAASQLKLAAQAFGKIPTLITDGPPDAPRPWQLFPWCFGAPEQWTAVQRRTQATVLRLALEQERIGITAIERALAEPGVTESFNAT